MRRHGDIGRRLGRAFSDTRSPGCCRPLIDIADARSGRYSLLEDVGDAQRLKQSRDDPGDDLRHGNGAGALAGLEQRPGLGEHADIDRSCGPRLAAAGRVRDRLPLRARYEHVAGPASIEGREHGLAVAVAVGGVVAGFGGGHNYVCRGAQFAGGDVLKGSVFGVKAAIRGGQLGDVVLRRLLDRCPRPTGQRGSSCAVK